MKYSTFKQLKIAQFQRKLKELAKIKRVPAPGSGWLQYFRTGFGHSQAAMGQLLGLSQPAIRQLEVSEAKGTITLKSLVRAADALGCDVEYRLIPRSTSKHGTSGKQAVKKSELEIVKHTMALEDQAIDDNLLSQ